MTGYGQGINKKVSFAKQTAKGTPALTGQNAQYLRRVTHIPNFDRDTYENNEIVSHQQSTGVTFGLKKGSSKLSGLLSPKTYSLLFAGLLRKAFVAGATTGALTTVASASTSGAAGTFTRTGGSYITDGFKVGDIIRVTGFATTGASNNSVNMLITALTATVMTLLRFDGIAIGAKTAGDSVTISVVGKKTLAPLTGHTNDYFSIEDWYPDVGASELYTDMQPSQIEVQSPATGNVTVGIDFIGLNRSRNVAQQQSDASTETTTGVVSALNGVLMLNGVVMGNVTGITITINGGISQGDAVIGSNSSVDIARGRIKVSGQFTGLFNDDSIQDLYDAESVVGLTVALLVNEQLGTSDFVTFNMGAVKITGDAPDDGEKLIVRTYPFTAQLNGSGGAATAYDQTIIAVQDSAA